MHFRLPTTVSVDLLAVITEGLHVVYKLFNASWEQDQIATLQLKMFQFLGVFF